MGVKRRTYKIKTLFYPHICIISYTVNTGGKKAHDKSEGVKRWGKKAGGKRRTTKI